MLYGGDDEWSNHKCDISAFLTISYFILFIYLLLLRRSSIMLVTSVCLVHLLAFVVTCQICKNFLKTACKSHYRPHGHDGHMWSITMLSCLHGWYRLRSNTGAENNKANKHVSSSSSSHINHSNDIRYWQQRLPRWRSTVSPAPLGLDFRVILFNNEKQY